jgi:ABC-2 type transport system permease protein
MKNIWIICQKEIRSYFVSPIGYAVIALFAIIFGLGFYVVAHDFVQYTFRAQMMGGGATLNVNEQIIRPILGFAGTVSLFLIPMITMRLFAEEKRNGTIELLLTSPVEDIGIVLGKWLGALVLYVCALGTSLLGMALLFAWGKPDWKPVAVAYLGLILQGACLLALGAFISSLTSNQIIAGAITFFASLMLYMLSWFTNFADSRFSKVLNYLSIITHLENFSKGLVDLKDVVFYVSFIFLALFLILRQMESLRWRS